MFETKKDKAIERIQEETGWSENAARLAYEDNEMDRMLGSPMLLLGALVVIALLYEVFIAALAPFSSWALPIAFWLEAQIGTPNDWADALGGGFLVAVVLGIAFSAVAIPLYIIATFWLLKQWTRFTLAIKIALGKLGLVLMFLEPLAFGALNYLLNSRWLGVNLQTINSLGEPWYGYALIAAAVLGTVFYVRSMMKTLANPLFEVTEGAASPMRIFAGGHRAGTNGPLD